MPHIVQRLIYTEEQWDIATSKGKYFNGMSDKMEDVLMLDLGVYYHRGETFDEDFIQFCRQATDEQLKNILRDEWNRHNHGDYPSARIASAERGWIIQKGEFIDRLR